MKKLLENFRKCIAEELAEGRTAEWKWLLEEMAVEILQSLAILAKNNFKNYKLAENYFLMAKFIDPGNYKLHLNLCDFYHGLMNPNKAEKFAKLAIESSQEQDSSAFNNMAIISNEKNDFDKTYECYQKALQLNNNNNLAKFGLACEKIRRGNLEDGWKEYQSRYDAFKHLGKFLVKYENAIYWDGNSHAKKNLVIFNDQGVGDFVFALRSFPELFKKKINIFFDVDNNIKSILNKTKHKKINYYEDTIKVDYFCGVMSLPYLLKQNEYCADSYNKVFDQSEKQCSEKPKIGITVAGNKTHASDYRRSINLSKLSSILDDNRFDFYLLQTKKDLIRERKCQFTNILDRSFPGIDLGNKLISYENTIDIIYDLDGLISVDTSIAHLAGALGVPVFLLLDKACDFRWQNDGNTTEWYKSWRLHRQKVLFDWDDAVESCHKDLLQFFKIEI